MAERWACSVCTAEHGGARAVFLACAVCGAEKPAPPLQRWPLATAQRQACVDLSSGDSADERPPKRRRNAFEVLTAAAAGHRPCVALSRDQQGGEVGEGGRRLEACEHETLPGQYLLLDFVSEHEEATLLAFLDSDEGGANPWAAGAFNGPHISKRWGVLTDLKANSFHPPERPMPAAFAPIIDRMRGLRLSPGPASEASKPSTPARRARKAKVMDVQWALRDFRPNEANAIAYHRGRGHRLRDHCDHRSLSGEVLVNLSLAGDATMTYRPAHTARGGRGASGGASAAVRVALPRRSLQVQTGTVRYDYTHGIRLEDLPSEGRRVSITFRQNVAGYGYYDEVQLKTMPGGMLATSSVPASAKDAKANPRSPMFKGEAQSTEERAVPREWRLRPHGEQILLD